VSDASQVYGTGSSTDILHTAFNAIVDHHFIPSIVDFYNSPTVRSAFQYRKIIVSNSCG